MHDGCRSSVCGGSGVYRVKAAKLYTFAIGLNARPPFLAVRMPRYATQPDRAIFARAGILRVDALIRVPQVAQPVVAGLAVDVVNHA
jgi:hypothetical protein